MVQTRMFLSITIALYLLVAIGRVAYTYQGQEGVDSDGFKPAKIVQTAFTYEGQLKDANGPVNGTFDFQFTLYAVQGGGDKLGVKELAGVVLASGLFKFELDFGRLVSGPQESWLEIGVRPGGSPEAYTLLFPRQKLAPTPYAIFAQHEQWSLIGVPVGFADRAVLQEGLAATLESNAGINPKENGNPSALTKSAAAPQGAPNFVAKFDGGGSPSANSIIFDNGTNTGIGTTSPGERLTVGGGSLADTKIEINAGGNQYAALRIKNNQGSWNWQVTPSADLPGGRLRLTDETAGREWLAITHAGNVGIGTAAPGFKLDVFSNSGTAIVGRTTFSGGVGVYGESAQFEGVRGVARDVNHGAVVGTHEGGGFGVYGQSNGAGVVGKSLGDGAGVYGESERFEGVRGVAKDVNHGGVVGVHNGAGIAVYGTSRGTGVQGDSTSANGYGGLFRNTGGGIALRIEGPTSTDSLRILGGADLSELFEVKAGLASESDVKPERVQPGMVVSIDPVSPAKLVISSRAYDRRVAGIISGAGGVRAAMVVSQAGSIADGNHPVALSGRVYCWADASNGPIAPGDLLTTSGTPGHAMKVTNHSKARGAIIGKALTPIASGRGLVLVLITLQ